LALLPIHTPVGETHIEAGSYLGPEVNVIQSENGNEQGRAFNQNQILVAVCSP
jgi:hypothetical protein